MHQLEGIRHRVGGDSGKWLRVGLASTTVIAPLVARWNELRTAKRDLRQREEAQSRLRQLRAGAQSRLEDVRARLRRDGRGDAHGGGLDGLAAVVADSEPARGATSDTVRIGLWLAGVGLGLMLAGTGAYFLARRRLATSSEEPLLELPATRAPADGARPDAPARERGPRRDAAQASHAVAGAPSSAEAQPEALHDVHQASEADAEPLAFTPAAEGNTVAEGARFVGNIHTMIYHDMRDAQHLPAEENRIYFETEDEAREAGYRRARNEIPPATEADVAAETPPA